MKCILQKGQYLNKRKRLINLKTELNSLNENKTRTRKLNNKKGAKFYG